MTNLVRHMCHEGVGSVIFYKISGNTAGQLFHVAICVNRISVLTHQTTSEQYCTDFHQD